MVDGVPANSLFIVLSKDSQLVDDGWCAAGERSLVDVDGGVEYIVRYGHGALGPGNLTTVGP